MKKRNKQENVWFSQHKNGEKNVDFDFKCLKFHLKFIRKTTTTGSSESTSHWIAGQWPSCSVYFWVKSPGVVLKIFHFLLHQFVHYRSFQHLTQDRFWKWKVSSPKSDAILVAINKRINTKSNAASWSSQWEAVQVLLHVWSYDFYEMGYFTE